ncbi:MAG: LysR family transcriptional regulator [Clostridiales Family XIII bacterium]|jgi:DNA-binding transcriptional LysR family regulator|nr:LysR family transcriptional regulator [Clostridiales Family XIII bacterium]
MDIESIRTFYTVAQYKSFQKAADILVLTQSGVSRRISGLENELGHLLFVRTHQSVSLSKYGEEYFPYAKRILKIQDEWVNAPNNVKDDTIKVAIPFSMNRFFPEMFTKYINSYKVPIRVHGANSNEIYEMLIDRTIDVGITSAVFPSPQITYDAIYKEKMVCVANAEVQMKHIRSGVIVKPPLPFVLCKMHSFKVHPWDAMIDSINTNSLVETVFTVNFFELTRTLAKKGLGATVLPYTEVIHELESGELAELHVPNMVLPMRITYMATNKQIQKIKSVEQFKTALIDHCKALPTNA